MHKLPKNFNSNCPTKVFCSPQVPCLVLLANTPVVISWIWRLQARHNQNSILLKQHFIESQLANHNETWNALLVKKKKKALDFKGESSRSFGRHLNDYLERRPVTSKPTPFSLGTKTQQDVMIVVWNLQTCSTDVLKQLDFQQKLHETLRSFHTFPKAILTHNYWKRVTTEQNFRTDCLPNSSWTLASIKMKPNYSSTHFTEEFPYNQKKQ